MQASLIEMPNHESHSAAALDGMFRLRHEVFKERLNWDVGSQSGRERDDFDDLEPVYLVCEHEGEVLGSWRALPTMGPYMMKNVFPELLYGHAAPEAEDIWEVSRFAVSKRVAGSGSMAALRTVTNILMEELYKFAMRRNLSRIVAVTDLRFERILNRSGYPTTRYGPPMQMGVSKALAAYTDVSEINLTARERGTLQFPSVQDAAAASTGVHKLAA